MSGFHHGHLWVILCVSQNILKTYKTVELADSSDLDINCLKLKNWILLYSIIDHGIPAKNMILYRKYRQLDGSMSLILI